MQQFWRHSGNGKKPLGTSEPTTGFLQGDDTVVENQSGAGNFAQVYSPCRAAHRNSEAFRVAYLPAQLLDSASECLDRIQSYAGAVAAFFVAIHVGCLHAGNLAGKTCRTSRS